VEGCAATVPAPRNPAEHCSGLQNCSLKIPDCFGVVIVILMYFLFICFEFLFCIVDVKKKRKKRKEKKKI
jgi:hypothetical protein